MLLAPLSDPCLPACFAQISPNFSISLTIGSFLQHVTPPYFWTPHLPRNLTAYSLPPSGSPCQLMPVSLNSTPAGIPNLVCDEESANSSIVMQHGCGDSTAMWQLSSVAVPFWSTQVWDSRDVRQPWGELVLGRGTSLARQLALLWSSPPALVHSTLPGTHLLLSAPVLVCSDLASHLWCFIFDVLAPAEGTQSSVFGGKWKRAVWAKREGS